VLLLTTPLIAGADTVGTPAPALTNFLATCAVSAPAHDGPLKFVTTRHSAVTVSSSGVVTFPDPAPASATYVVSGFVTDTHGNAGTWKYTAIAEPNPNSVYQITETHGTGSVTTGSAFTDTITAADGTVSAPSTLAPGTYVVSGTDSAINNNNSPVTTDTGIWGYVLTVTPPTTTPIPREPLRRMLVRQA
jgi:hypothetical protein